MIKQVSNFVASVACILAVALSTHSGLAADKVNYSGNYLLEGKNTKAGGETGSSLEVVQSQDSIEITRVEQGRRTRNRYPLTGSDGDYTSPGGVSGRCKAQPKGKYLVVESIVVSRPQPTGSPVRMHTKERWRLSADSKILTIEANVDFPDFPAGISNVVNDAYASGTQKYVRAGNP